MDSNIILICASFGLIFLFTSIGILKDADVNDVDRNALGTFCLIFSIASFIALIIYVL